MRKGFAQLEIMKKLLQYIRIKSVGGFAFNSKKIHKNGAVFLTGFTLLELLIVIGILAILTTVVVLVINPVEYLKQARDSSRMSDILTLSTALNHYQLTGASFGTENVNYVSLPSASSTCGDLGLPALQPGWSYHCSTQTNYKNTNGTGWIPFDFTSVPGGSIIGSLPIDPVNSTSSNLWYNFGVVNSKYEVWAQNLESVKFISKAADDGGISATAYEIGTDLTIAPHAAIAASSTLSQTTDTDFNGGTSSAVVVSGSGVSGSVALNAYQYQVLNTSNLISYWKMDNNWNDSKNNNNGNAFGTTFAAAKIGAYSGSIGTNQYINVPNNTNLNFGTSTNFSIEAWVKRSVADATSCFIIDKRSSASAGYIFYFTASTQTLAFNFNSSVITTNLTLTDLTSWHHVVITADRTGNVIAYLDGVASTPQATPAVNITTANQLTIGGHSFNQPYGSLRGLMDELAVYDKILTPTEVSNHYNIASSGTFTSSVMDAAQSSTFSTMDYSATTNASTTLTMDIRAGNTATPDGTWTSWIANVSNGGDISALGTNRYVQYRANFSTTDSSQAPILNDVTVNYSYYH